LGTSTDTNSFRIFNSVAPPTRISSRNDATNLANQFECYAGISFNDGEYWIDCSLNAGTGGNFTPGTTIVNTRYTPLMNRSSKSNRREPGHEISDDGTPGYSR
jgi:hypothetical protein